MEEVSEKKVDPLSYSHRKNPIYMTKTVCGLDIDSTLDIKGTIDDVTCPICKALSAVEPNPADHEPNPADNEPNPADNEPKPQKPADKSADQVIHWTCGIGSPVCLEPNPDAMTNDRSEVTCPKCLTMIEAINKIIDKPTGGISVVVVTIPSETMTNFFGTLLADFMSK